MLVQFYVYDARIFLDVKIASLNIGGVICSQEVLRSTRAQLERELLSDDVTRIEDMPSYSLLS